MSLRWLPNAITVARMVTALPLLWLLAVDNYALAFWVALGAGASDFLDGFLARRFDWRSAIGALLDPLADKLLLAVCFLGLWWSSHLPTWLTALVIGRDLVLVAGALTWRQKIGPLQPEPSFAGKFSTFAQIALVLMVLLWLNGWRGVGELELRAVMLATAAVTALSGIDYVARYGLRAWRALGSKA